MNLYGNLRRGFILETHTRQAAGFARLANPRRRRNTPRHCWWRRRPGCGTVKAKLGLSEHTYRCDHCGLAIDGT
jgi:hypothetical protein